MHRMNPAKPYQATPKNGGVYRGNFNKPKSVSPKKTSPDLSTKSKNPAAKVTPELKEEKQWLAEIGTFSTRSRLQGNGNYSTLGLCMGVMLLTASFANVASAAPIEDPKGSSVIVAKMIRQICTTKPFVSPNKSVGMILARYQQPSRKYVTASTACKGPVLFGIEKSQKCLEDIAQHSAIDLKLPPTLAKLRDETNTELNHVVAGVQLKFNEMRVGLSADLENKLLQIINAILQIREYKLSYERALKIKMGNCGEQADYAATEILKVSDKYKMPIRLQRVRAFAADGFSHGFLLIDSDLPDVKIQKDVKRATAYLKSIKQGYVCDPWQEGYFEPATSENDGNLIYRGGYEDVSVTTVSLDFDLNGFPSAIVKYIHAELDKLGLKVISSGATPFHFFKSADATQSATTAAVLEGPKQKHEL